MNYGVMNYKGSGLARMFRAGAPCPEAGIGHGLTATENDMPEQGTRAVKFVHAKLNRSRARAIGLALLISVWGTVLISPAAAQSETLSPAVARVLGTVYEDMQADRFEAAFTAVNNLINSRRASMSPYELSTALELRGSIQANLTRYPGALQDFEEVIRLNALPPERLKQIRYYIAQLFFQQQDYVQAIRYLEEYVSDPANKPDANTYYLLAAAYVQTDQFAKAQSPAEQAVSLLAKPNKGYYDLLNSIYSQTNENRKRAELLRRMINLWPDESSYWTQLAGAYSTLGQDREAASALELAYKAGLVQKEAQIIALVQYYSVLENPYRGGQLLAKEMAAGNVARTQKNLELLAQMWNLAREQKRAVGPLTEAANLSSDGKLFYRLGQVYFADEQWAKAEQSLTKAVNKGGLARKESGDCWVLIGSARFNTADRNCAKRERAIEAFRRATNFGGKAKKSADDWISYIQEIKRTEQAQDRIECQQRNERAKARIDRCKSTIRVAELGGTDYDAETVVNCRAEVSTFELEDCSKIKNTSCS